VQDRSVSLSRALGVDDEAEIQAIKAASLLHDVGKLAIPEHILNKPGRLTPAEYDIMKRHAAIGADILSVIGFPFAVAPIVRSHHENWDGTGYPDGIAGERIPVGSRILAVVDCFDALTSDRPYRPRMTDEEALRIIGERSGTMYDPRVVDAFFALHGAGAELAAVAAPANQPHSALQTPVRTGEDHRQDLEPHTFFEFGRAIGSPASSWELGDALWSQFRVRLPASLFVLYGYERADDSIVALYEVPCEPFSIFARRIPLGERLSGWVAATGQPVVNSDARLDLDEEFRDQSSLRSALAVPVLSHDQPIAVLSLYAEAPAAFDDVHRTLVAVVATAVAPILEALRAETVAQLPAAALQNSTRV
jgi:putative nucleotidyltransferase with HDIG domain